MQARSNLAAWTVRARNEVYTSNGDFTAASAIETVATRPAALALDDTHVYYAESGPSGRVMRRVHAGQTPLVVGQGMDGGVSTDLFNGVAAIAAGATHVVWVDANGVYRKLTTSDAAFADGPATALDTTIKDGLDVLIDDAKRKAYVFTSGGRLHVLPLDGGPAEEIAGVPAVCTTGLGMAHEDDPGGTSDPYVYLACASSILRVMK